MKKLMMAAAVLASAMTFAADASKTTKPADKQVAAEKPAAEANAAEVAPAEKPPIFWGFANYGIYSGYQLYGSIVNTEPTLQGYGEINANLSWNETDLGYFGFGLWSNTDLTGKRNDSYRRAFNEFDFNLHWQKTFWFDDNRQYGLTYRTYVVWYFYPHTGGHRENTKTTFDWDHYFQFDNPYVIPYINIVHEYAQSHGNLLQFGIKKPWQITDEFSLCPFIELVWRNRNYGWCFSNYGNDPEGQKIDQGLATLKLELDATYMFTPWLGVFAKIAYCQNLDPNLRYAANYIGSQCCSYDAGAAYGRWNEFCWGGVGVCVSF